MVFVGVPDTRGDIGLLAMDGAGTIEYPLRPASDEQHPTVSPDGHWLAYTSDRSGRPEVYVERFPEFVDRQPISTAGGMMPVWAPHGRELYYVTHDTTQVMRVAVSTEQGFSAEAPSVMSALRVYDFLGAGRYDVTPDGEHLLMVTRPGAVRASDVEPTHIVLVQNWFEELKRLVPVD